MLDDWRATGADLPKPLSVKQALALLQEEGRSVRSTITLTAAGLKDGLADQLTVLPCVVASDGQRVVPPSEDSAEAVAEHLSPLAEELGIVTALHAAHLEDTDDAGVVIKWLRESGALLDGTDDRVVVRRLAMAGRSERRLEEPLTDGQIDRAQASLPVGRRCRKARTGTRCGTSDNADSVRIPTG